jgi:hypothetical protein
MGIGVGYSSGAGGYIVIDNCEFSGFSHGGVKGKYRFWIKNSYFYDIGYNGDGGGSKDHAIYTGGDFSTDNEAVYEYNLFENITGSGIQIYNGGKPISHHVVRYNIFNNCNTAGSDHAAVQLAASHSKVYNNTFYNNAKGIMFSRDVSHDNLVYNNLFKGNYSRDIAEDTFGGQSRPYNNTVEYNFFGSAKPGSGSNGTGNIIDSSHNPFAHSSPKAWYQLTLIENSKCRDAGKNLGKNHVLGLDPFDSSWVPSKLNQDNHGSGWEMGAFVFSSGPSSENTPSPPTGLTIIN